MAHSSYLYNLMYPDKLEETAKIITDAINYDKKKLDINGIAVTGMSGIVVGGLISVNTKLPIILVRKEFKNSHSNLLVETSFDYHQKFNYVFVDDLVSGGSTLARVYGEIKDHYKSSNLVKIYLYADSDSKSSKLLKDFYRDSQYVKKILEEVPNVPIFSKYM